MFQTFYNLVISISLLTLIRTNYVIRQFIKDVKYNLRDQSVEIKSKVRNNVIAKLNNFFDNKPFFNNIHKKMLRMYKARASVNLPKKHPDITCMCANKSNTTVKKRRLYLKNERSR